MLYRLRFTIAADLRADWLTIAGLASQVNNLSVIIQLPTAKSIGVAPPYDSPPSAHLEELARARANRAAGAVDFMDLLSSERQRFKIHATDQAAKTGHPPPRFCQGHCQGRGGRNEGQGQESLDT